MTNVNVHIACSGTVSFHAQNNAVQVQMLSGYWVNNELVILQLLLNKNFRLVNLRNAYAQCFRWYIWKERNVES